jgi:hypothetical protein
MTSCPIGTPLEHFVLIGPQHIADVASRAVLGVVRGPRSMGRHMARVLVQRGRSRLCLTSASDQLRGRHYGGPLGRAVRAQAPFSLCATTQIAAYGIESTETTANVRKG